MIFKLIKSESYKFFEISEINLLKNYSFHFLSFFFDYLQSIKNRLKDYFIKILKIFFLICLLFICNILYISFHMLISK